MTSGGPSIACSRFLLIVVGSALGLLAAEGAVRVYLTVRHEIRLDEWLTAATAELEGVSTSVREQAPRLALLLEPTDHPEMIYRLRPGLDLHYAGLKLTTNPQGYRGPPLERNKPAETIRILVLGDSVSFGWGVSDGECYPRVLERELNRNRGSRRIEVINAGVPGYNTAMELAYLERDGLVLDPDLVLLDFVGNDLELPNFIVSRIDPWDLGRSLLLELVQVAVSGRELDDDRPFQNAPRREGRFESDPMRVPVEYRHMVGEEAYRRSVRRIRALGEEHGFRLVMTAHNTCFPLVRELCDELEVPLILGSEVSARYRAQHGLRRHVGSPLTISESDPHPSALFHRLLGEHYADRLIRLGVIE